MHLFYKNAKIPNPPLSTDIGNTIMMRKNSELTFNSIYSHSQSTSDDYLIPLTYGHDDAVRSRYRHHYLYQDPCKFNENQIAIHAAKCGDKDLLEILLDPIPPTLQQEEMGAWIALHKNREEHIKLTRIKKIKKQQILVSAYFHTRFCNEEFGTELQSLLETEQRAMLQAMLYTIRVEHQNMLRASTEVFSDNKAITLNNEERVRLHKNFSQQLEIAFKRLELDFSKQAPNSQYWSDNLKNEIDILDKKRSDLNRTYSKLSTQYKEIIITKNTKLDKHNDRKNKLITWMRKIDFKDQRIKREHLQCLEKLSASQVSIDMTDVSSGENLLHIALLNRQFKTAKYLVLKEINYLHKNKKEIPALHYQQENGDTFLHYLAKCGDFELLCHFLNKDVDCSITNNNFETIFDITHERKSLLHYLLEKMQEKNQQDSIAELLQSLAPHLLVSHFLILDAQNKSVAQKLSESTLKFTLLNSVIHVNLKNPKFCNSVFQKDINFIMWNHLLFALEQQASTWTKKIISSSDKIIAQQLQFLKLLERHLVIASQTHCDKELYRFLKHSIDIIIMPNFKDNYQLYVHRYEEAEKQSFEKKHYFATPNSKINLMFFPKIHEPQVKKILQKEGKVRKKSTKHVHFKLPLKCTDPMHWFSPKKTNRVASPEPEDKPSPQRRS